MAYNTAAGFIQCYDKRRVAQWLSDDNTPLTDSQVLSSTILAELLRQATKMIDAAATVGARYAPSELATLAVDTENGGLIRRLCADLTWGLLAKRRGYSTREIGEMAPGYGEALAMLDQLRLGERIFDLSGVPEAGLPDVAVLGSQGGGVTGTPYANRYFGCTPQTRNSSWYGTNPGCGGC